MVQFQPGNVYGSSRLGVGVGNKDWLNSVESQVQAFWRRIEYGDAAAGVDQVGQVMRGLWTDARVYRTGNPYRRDPHETPGPYSFFGTSAGQEFVPLSSLDSSGRKQAGSRKRGEGQRASSRGIFKTPIRAHHMMVDAARELNLGRLETDALREALTAAGFAKAALGRRPRTASSARNEEFLARNLRGSFVGGFAVSTSNFSPARIAKYQEALVNANRQIALLVAEAAVKRLESTLVRPGISKGLLADRLLQPQNRFPS